jgi:hypothetical protein
LSSLCMYVGICINALGSVQDTNTWTSPFLCVCVFVCVFVCMYVRVCSMLGLRIAVVPKNALW